MFTLNFKKSLKQKEGSLPKKGKGSGKKKRKNSKISKTASKKLAAKAAKNKAKSHKENTAKKTNAKVNKAKATGSARNSVAASFIKTSVKGASKNIKEPVSSKVSSKKHKKLKSQKNVIAPAHINVKKPKIVIKPAVSKSVPKVVTPVKKIAPITKSVPKLKFAIPVPPLKMPKISPGVLKSVTKKLAIPKVGKKTLPKVGKNSKKKRDNTQDQVSAMIQKMMDQAQEMIDSMNQPAEEEPMKIDGISSSFATVSPEERQFKDQTPVEADIEDLEGLSDLSISSHRPEIIARFEGAGSSNTHSIGSKRFVDLLEANIMLNRLTDDVYETLYEDISEEQNEFLEGLIKKTDLLYESIKEEKDTILNYRRMIDDAIDCLDLHVCSDEIGQLSEEILKEMLTPEDVKIEELPSGLVDLVEALENNNQNITEKYSNTKLYYSLLSNLYRMMVSGGSYRKNSNTNAGPLSYESRSSDYTIPKLKTRVGQFTSTRNPVSAEGGSSQLLGDYSGSLLDKVYDMLTMISNELVISGGINRLVGKELGNKYNPLSSDPLTKLFGNNLELTNDKSTIITKIPTSVGSLLDFMTLEDSDSQRVVLPFEVNDIDVEGSRYLAGSSYMIEGPARKIDQSFTNPLGDFYQKITNELDGSVKYLNDLMGLDETAGLASQSLMIRILVDIQKICQEFANPEEASNFVTIGSAVLVSQSKAGETKTMMLPPDSSGKKYEVDKASANVRFMIKELSSYEKGHTVELGSTTSEYMSDANIKKVFRFDGEIRRPLKHIISGNKKPKKISDTSQAIKFKNANVLVDVTENFFEVNVVGMIKKTCDEFLSEAENFAKRKGEDASITDDNGLTMWSKFDYSFFLLAIHEIYACLINEFIEYEYAYYGNGEPRLGIKYITVNREKTQIAADFFTFLLNAFSEGSDLDSFFDADGNPLLIPGVSRNTQIGKTITSGEIIDLIDNMKLHRTYIKSIITNLQAISKNINQKSAELTQFQTGVRRVLEGKEKLVNVKNKSIKSFVQLINQPIGKDVLRSLTAMQCSNTLVSYERMRPENTNEKRQQRYVTRPGIIEALRIFYESQEFLSTQNVVCVGMPNAMIDSLRKGKVDTNIRKGTSSTNGEFKIRFSKDNELYSSITYEDYDIKYNSYIYLLPDSYDNIKVASQDELGTKSEPDPVRRLVNNTVFYKIISGKVIERKTGAQIIEQENDDVYEVLKNHVYSDLYRISINIAMGIDMHESDLKKYSDLNYAHISAEGRKVIESISKIEGVQMFHYSDTFSNLLQPVEIDETEVFYEMTSGERSGETYYNVGEHETSDLKRAGQSCLYTAELDRHRILGSSIFDRVFYVNVGSDNFNINENSGTVAERSAYNESVQKFDLLGLVCDVRVE